MCTRSGDGSSVSPETVAVAVRGGSSSRRAVRWAIDNLMPDYSYRLVLIHVMPRITSIPTPSGVHIPITQVDDDVVAIYKQDIELKFEEIFLSFKKLCKTRKIELLVLEDDNPADALIRYMSESGCKSLVIGASSNFITRRLRGPDLPSTVLKNSPNTFNIYVISKGKLQTKLVDSSSASDNRMFSETDHNREVVDNIIMPDDIASSQAYANVVREDHKERPHQNFNNGMLEIQNLRGRDSVVLSKDSKLSQFQDELAKLQLELRSTLAMYDQACKDLVHVQQQVQSLSFEYLEESRKVNNLLEREKMLVRFAAEEKAKQMEAIKEVETAKQLLAKEVQERQLAEGIALQKASEKQKTIDSLLFADKRYRRYTKEEIEVATEFFSDSKMIGEGGYGKVYRCILDHTPVAIKVLHPDSFDKREEFLREVEILSQLRHPHLVLLLGACPEIGCLVYEYMENESLQECLFCSERKPPLPWYVRFRIVYEVACGLSFLHGSVPEQIIHRDLKPGNILLDRNYVSKIGDVGLAKLVVDVVPDNITEYRNSVLMGTFYYMDPEYQRTGTIRAKSDIYALGIIILQLLTAHKPNGLVATVENAINDGSLDEILDKSIADWPLSESEELARIALKCSRLRCRDRPDLELEILPVLEKLMKITDASCELLQKNLCAPSHFFCPIIQEVMDDPYIAADGFTYEYNAIKAWLEKHNVSPVTRLKLQNTSLTPNSTLRSAIHGWNSHIKQKDYQIV